MNYSFPRACEACGQEDGVGFKNGEWLCDACLKKPNISDEPEKPSRSRRIFAAQVTPFVVHAFIETVNRSPPLGERAAQAVISDNRERFRKKPEARGRQKQAKGFSPSKKKGGRKQQPSRSKRFAKRSAS